MNVLRFKKTSDGWASKEFLLFINIVAILSTGFVGCDKDYPVGEQGTQESAQEISPEIMIGAKVPWKTYSSSQAQTDGSVLRSIKYGEIASEAVERICVELEPGEQISWKAEERANALILRYCIPDSAEGGGTQASLMLNVNGEARQTISLDSEYSWLYGTKENPQSNAPADGPAHVFFSETRAFIEGNPILPRDTFTLTLSESATGAWVVVDLIDLEWVEPPLPRPEDTLSIVDFGAVPNDGVDDTDALLACIEQARTEQKPVWIPAGTFRQSQKIELSNVRVQGSGMWHTRLMPIALATPQMGFQGNLGFRLVGDNVQVSDLMIEGLSRKRYRDIREHAFTSSNASHFLIENIWVEKVKTGMWLGQCHYGVIRGCRIRNTYADGININNNSSDILVEQTHTRNTGDDGLASFSNQSGHGTAANQNITFRSNTLEAAWWAHGIGIYGGTGITAERNLIRGVSRSVGIVVESLGDTGFTTWPGSDIQIRQNLIIDCGGTSWKQQWGGFWVYCVRDTLEVSFVENLIVNAAYDAIKLQGSSNVEKAGRMSVELRDNRIVNPGGDGVLVRSNARGSLLLSGNVYTAMPAGQQALQNKAPSDQFTITQPNATEH